MKRIHNILLGVVAFAAVSCIDEVNNSDVTSVKTGDDVQFGLTLPGMTRTIYGEKSSNAYPIYWVDGDKVQIYSPQCHSGRNNAEYKVAVNGPEQNYATSLIPTGENGVQWGVDETADFYSVYPSGDSYAIDYKPKGYEEGKESVLTIENLKINFLDKFEVSSNGVVEPMGSDCLMIAKAENVKKGDFVNLKYSPIATSVIITLQGPTSGSAVTEHTIQSVKLIAPEGTDIAGTFNVQWDNEKYSFAKWSSDSEKSNEITAQLMVKGTNQFYTIKQGETLAVPLFLVPTDLTIDGNWKVQVVATTQTFTKKLSMGDDGELTPGMVHELPALPALDVKTDSEWKVENWMTNIPRNVYLSELSLPGTWNSLNVDCQSNTSIPAQYALGVRAFHLDTRWRADNRPLAGSTFSGITKPIITELSVATGGADQTYKYDGGNLMRKDASATLAEHLKSITDQVRGDEYMIVFCTFAQNSYNGDLCPSTWYGEISDACAENSYVYDASTLTANTVVGDVLGKVIVIVNLESTVSTDTELPADSKCLFTYIPMLLPDDYYEEGKSHEEKLYYGSKQESDVTMLSSHAQISTTNAYYVNCGDRGYSHPLTKRDNLITTIWDSSKLNNNNQHNQWIYLGLGGYIMNSSTDGGSGYDTVENRYAQMVYNRIEEMGGNNVPYYRLGVILMNHKQSGNYKSADGKDLGYDFSDVCREVLLLNNKYTLQYDSSKPTE